MEQSKLLFVINPVSGGEEKINWENDIKDYYKNTSAKIEMHILNGENDAPSLKQHITAFKPDKVVAVGGDGTVKLVGGLLLNTSIPLGIIAAGSANGMAKELNLPSKLSEALNIINTGIIKKIDVICIDEKDFSFHLSDMGLNALLIKYYQKNNEHGKLGYARAIFKALWRKQLMNVELQYGSAKLNRNAYMVVIANARTYGTGAVINPDGNLFDGKFEVIIVKSISLLELFKMLISHKEFDSKKTEIIQTEEISITAHRKAYFQIDGEYRGRIKTVKAKILKSALGILLPK
ncbi:MAG: diacylglycerol/lipid kinase family protein [Chitinophagaceae bacterium]